MKRNNAFERRRRHILILHGIFTFKKKNSLFCYRFIGNPLYEMKFYDKITFNFRLPGGLKKKISVRMVNVNQITFYLTITINVV